ncbi:MAG: PD40 domain-containing protein [Saprospiraceae bacterium]|nr:PD40 domain-containing protein [Saprospiraceae bacterium]
MKLKYIIITSVFTLVFQLGFAQSDHKQQALLYFEAGRYYDAIKEFDAYKKTEKDPQLLIKRGLCHLNTNNPDGCIKDMVAAEKLKSLDDKRYKYIAMCYIAKYEYTEAAKFFKTYLNTLNSSSPEWNEIILKIKKCGYAANYKYRHQNAYVENLGSDVNTRFDEFGPVQSPTRPERYYFSSAREGTTGGLRNVDGLSDVLRGHYSSDMYMVDLINGNWSSVLTFGALKNSPQHDILQDFSQDGSVLFYTKCNKAYKCVLFTDTLNVENIPSQLSEMNNGFPFNASKGDKDLFIFNDSLILFSSIKEEGEGGYDIYYTLKKDNIWQTPVNFRYPINTSANEIAPFLIKNGSVLYFSSDKTETYGGYDIFSATFTPDGKLDQVSNSGYPINSPGNDIDVEVSHDGMFALFASDRAEGYGGKDLYTAYFKEQITGMLETVENPAFISVFENNLSSTDVNVPIETAQKSAIPQRDFVCKPIYFAQDEDVLNTFNQNSLKSLADLMLIYPELKVQLFSHFTSDGKKEFDLYFSIKRAEKAAEFLAKSGINERRIHMFGCGANYPVAAPFINNIPSTLAGRTNRRIDLNILHSEDTNLKIMYDFPAVAGQYRDSLWDNFITNNQVVTFRVHFANVVQMLKNEVLSLSNDIIVEKGLTDKSYTYTMGNYTSYDDALKMQSFLRTKGFEKARIMPYHKGTLVSRLDLIKLSAQYPDIEKFLSSGE